MRGEYAKGTDVPVEKSRNELESTLKRYGADAFGYAWDDAAEGGRAVTIQFRARGWFVRLRLALPVYREYSYTATGKERSNAAIRAAVAAEERRRWRSLLLVVKAKLESVELGVESFEQAFLANLMLPDGRTVAEWVEPQMVEIYETGQMPKALPGASLALGDGRR